MTYAPIEGVCPVCHQDSERQLPKGWHHDEVVQLRQQLIAMSKKLVERARKARTSLGASLYFWLCAELADCVAKLEAENAALRQQVDAAERDRKLCYGCNTALDEANDAQYARQGKPTYEQLKKQLEQTRLKNATVYGTSHPEIYKTVEDELRQQLAAFHQVAEVVKNPSGQIRIVDLNGNAFDLCDNMGLKLYAKRGN